MAELAIEARLRSEMVSAFYAATDYAVLTAERREVIDICAATAARFVAEANERADEAGLRAIEALNPGIDMDEVRRIRASRAIAGPKEATDGAH